MDYINIPVPDLSETKKWIDDKRDIARGVILSEGFKGSRKKALEFGKKWGIVITAVSLSTGFLIFFSIYNRIQRKKIKKLKKELRQVKKEAGIE